MRTGAASERSPTSGRNLVEDDHGLSDLIHYNEGKTGLRQILSSPEAKAEG